MNKKRCVVNVSTGAHYVAGQFRLKEALERHAPLVTLFAWTNRMPEGCPSHQENPYAFKAWAIKHALDLGFEEVIWMDSSILPILPLDRIWERASQDGAWIGRNGWANSQWTADSAYPHLFPVTPYAEARLQNKAIEHVVATAFAVDVRHPIGYELARQYIELATSGCFQGPWDNLNRQPDPPTPGPRASACGPPDCRGHRHDQTALSVIAWRLGIPLTSSPDFFAYIDPQRPADPGTVLLADGGHVRRS